MRDLNQPQRTHDHRRNHRRPDQRMDPQRRATGIIELQRGQNQHHDQRQDDEIEPAPRWRLGGKIEPAPRARLQTPTRRAATRAQSEKGSPNQTGLPLRGGEIASRDHLHAFAIVTGNTRDRKHS